MDDQPVVISCPHCAFSRTVARSAIPAGAMRAVCPKCRNAFDLGKCFSDRTPDGERPIPRTLSFIFRGTGSEYFGIWIVNMLLKIATCGVYSAWAKVRKRAYFYGNTELAGDSFAYVADPLVIFKGWMIGAVAFLLYMIAQRVSPLLSVVLALAFFVALPWLVVRSRMFNARNSAYRNIRFAFRPNYQEAYLVFLGLPILTLFTMGLLAPYVQYRQKKFLVENSFYGSTTFAFRATPAEYYRVYLIAAGALLVLAAAGGAAVAMIGIGGIAGVAKGAKPSAAGASAAAIAFISLVPLAYFFLGVYLQTALANLGWNATTIGASRFRSELRLRDMAWLYVSNAVAIACTLGLLTPWATVRMARYRCSRLIAETAGDLDGFLALAGRGEPGATGEEIGDIFGVNVDFGF